MASDIVPIQLSLTEGDLVTLWAPRWREDGEDWEAFLGDEDALFGFPEVAQLAAFVRTAPEHDLVDHPAWSEVPSLTVAELTPEESRRFDIIGVPELVAEEPDTWTIGELAEIVAIVRSLADVCDLELVDRILDSTPGFALLDQGTLPFSGREGARLWMQLAQTVADRWDEVVDALDEMVATPAVDAAALARAEQEAAELAARLAEAEEGLTDPEDIEAADEEAIDDQVAEDEAELAPTGFWEDIGIDPIRVTTTTGSMVTLRCYLDDKPVFLGSDGRIDAFDSERALARWLADGGKDDNDLVAASTWQDVLDKAAVGELTVTVDPMNDYVLVGIDEDIAEGTLEVDPTQLELATELVLDVAEWAGDPAPAEALAESQSLGWLVSFIIRPNPTRLAPSPPFTAEAARWRDLAQATEARFRSPA
ncbi:primosomal protein [Pseudonocardia sp. WMMC193]|uniref:primosomal protein n=1 Tax=Pseudonocardia sp. WMMC193 TaxID=2911965 RepID=UPI001F4100E1|nr:primosomal protein [Pseudonocardia sp. WMMC193]MCF7553237.1 primosomal protein [Pseudonocardia sp. WMMC193]